jgi:hypothetical protein
MERSIFNKITNVEIKHSLYSLLIKALSLPAL